MQRFEDRVAVITGGAGGIGRATAQRLAAEGATVVVVVVDVDADAGTALANELGGLFVAADVTGPEDNERVYAQTHAAYGRIDVAFHNAGISPPDDDSILETGLEAWKRVQDVNLTSVYLGCRAVLPYMLDQGRGSIVNTASFVATMGAATSQISYTASKGGVLAMTRELGVQFARQGGARERALARAGRHAAADGAVRRGPGAGRAPARARAARPVRRAVGDRRRGGVPGQRRRVVHHGVQLPGGRRVDRGVRQAPVRAAP